MKKKNSARRRLLSAAGMLAISAAMLSSATFAWFSMNRTVKAQIMTMTAKSADPFLQISANGTDYYTNLAETADVSTNTGAWEVQTKVTINSQPKADAKLKLIAPKTIGSTMTWVWNSSTNPDVANTTAVTDASNKAVTLDVVDANKNDDRSEIMTGTVDSEELQDAFVLKQTLSLKNVAKDAVAKNLKIDSVTFTRDDVTITNPKASDFEKAARILVVNESGAYALYKYDGTLIAAENSATGTAMSKTSDGKAIIAAELNANASTKITIYMYFDGNAVEATTNNAYDLSGVHAAFQFSVDERTATTA